MTGILLVDKPAEWTSHDVVAKLRRPLGERRIGHSGTLDPMATGLLVVFVGRATRGVEFAETHDKRYIAKLRLGTTTDTGDIWGNVLSQSALKTEKADLENALKAFRGDFLQTPPMYSAIKQNGKKMYELARAGLSVELPPRAVHIGRLDIIGFEDGDWVLDVCCSKGTYIRSLCHDIGEAIGCGGTLSGLRRIETGLFSIENAVTPDQIVDAALIGDSERYLRPLDELFLNLPSITADSEQEQRLRNGAAYACETEVGCYRVYGGSGEFLMLGKVSNGKMKTIKSFFEVS